MQMLQPLQESCSMANLTHLNDQGEAVMVDVSAKAATTRSATAEAIVQLTPAVIAALRDGKTPKGDVMAVVRVAAIQAAKRTPDLIPLCHPLNISKVDVEITLDVASQRAHIVATVKLTGQTGVEMEALTAASVGALTLYDMLKGLDKGLVIQQIRLLEKSGGKSGDWHAQR
jgi:cyclic pyranopterin monophosphate synthase